MTFPKTASLAALLLASTSLAAVAEPVFNRIASFPVASNLPEGADPKAETSSEIISASKDGMTLVYSDSPHGGIGFIDITDPKAPKAGGYIKFDGEPTSVAFAGTKALVGFRTSETKADPSGELGAVDLATREQSPVCELGGQPDSVAVAPDGSFAAIAIENERDEELNDGALPQMPAGFLVTVPLAADGTPDCAGLKKIEMTGLAEISPEDPEPEFVDINQAGEIVVSLQENNHIVIVDGKTGTVTSHFSAGSLAIDGVDTEKDGKLDFSGSVEARPREPDTVKWLKGDRIAVANEGDWNGGTRSFTIFNRDGSVSYESGASFELAVARLGHFPDKRADKKGVEPEGLATGNFGGKDYLFVLAERASVVGVYEDTGAEPVLTQILPSGIAPEGAVTIASRNLLVTANESDLVEDGAARSHVMLYERAEGTAAYPQIVSQDVDGKVLGFGALSGLVAAAEPNQFYAISDSFYSAAPSIFTVDASAKPAKITAAMTVTRDGKAAKKLDLEGIALDGEGGFWLGSEGNTEKEVPHALLHVDAKGAIAEEIAFPKELLEGETRFGTEGVTLVDGKVWLAIQRPWKNDPKNQTKLVSYDPAAKSWGAVLYPLDAPQEGMWTGLSEITAHGDHVYLIERDNGIGETAQLKSITRVAIADLQPAPLGGALPVVKKELVRDLLPELKSATNGYVVDKVEGLAIDADGMMTIVTDNDGVDDSSGETLFFQVGKTEEKAASLAK
ncbi:esterase-like activity of phytase family protein [Aureimonas glaciei]|uniref:Alkaline phosphatase n=1 Tax=Aureimonas glaciei TaxID=1776957 RepID=A0A917D8T9_9HYPH|nr:esterase-like activity of phytase family protein [Aureimonas glaciei]GGD09495.1 alkaline phosphatase [Aureimonas glaciei]